LICPRGVIIKMYIYNCRFKIKRGVKCIEEWDVDAIGQCLLFTKTQVRILTRDNYLITYNFFNYYYYYYNCNQIKNIMF